MSRREYGLHKVGKVWHCEFTVGAIYVHRSTRRREYEDARGVAKQWHQETLDLAQGLPVSSDITVASLWEKWCAWARVNHSESHVDRVGADWIHHILPYVGQRQARTLRDADAEFIRTKFLSEPSRRNEYYGLARHKSRTTEGANKVMRHLRLVFRWGVKLAGVLASVPFSVRIERPDEPQRTFLRKEQIGPFLAAVDTCRSLHMKIMVRLQLMLGIREKEARTLRWEDFSHNLSEVTIRGKTETAPPIPVPEELQTRLRKLGSKREGYVLPAWDGGPHPASYSKSAIARGAAAKGVDLKGKLTPHRMRGSYATMAARAGFGAHVIKKALRHDLLETSDKYVKLDTQDVAALQAHLFGEAPQKSRKLSAKKIITLIIRHNKNKKS